MIYAIFAAGVALSFQEIIALVLAYTIAMLFSFSIHEFSHAFVAYKMGDNTAKAMGRMTLNPFKHIDLFGIIAFLFIGFGWAKPVQTNPLNYKKYRKGRVFVSLAGVTANIILAFVFSGVYFFTLPALVGSTNLLLLFVSYLLNFMIVINLALFVFNLLPIYPLDGFNFITAFMRPMNSFINFMYRYGSLIMIFIVITPIFDYIYDFVTSNIMSLFFSFWGLFI